MDPTQTTLLPAVKPGLDAYAASVHFSAPPVQHDVPGHIVKLAPAREAFDVFLLDAPEGLEVSVSADAVDRELVVARRQLARHSRWQLRGGVTIAATPCPALDQEASVPSGRAWVPEGAPWCRGESSVPF